MLTIDGDGLNNVIFKKIRTNDATGKKSAPYRNFLVGALSPGESGVGWYRPIYGDFFLFT